MGRSGRSTYAGGEKGIKVGHLRVEEESSLTEYEFPFDLFVSLSMN